MSSTELLDIPENLLQYATNRFDQLLSQGQIIWQPYEASNAEDKGFKVSLNIFLLISLSPNHQRMLMYCSP